MSVATARAIGVDLATCRLLVDGQPVPVGWAELRMAAYLLAASPEFVSRSELMREVYGWKASSPRTRTIDQTISRLRRRLALVGARDAVQSLHGYGYRLVGRA